MHCQNMRSPDYCWGGKTELANCLTPRCKDNELLVPAHSEIILEGYIDPNEMADEGPFGDHTGTTMK